jgi:hypothetical protein
VSVESDALAYYTDTSLLSKQAIATILALWRRLDAGDISSSWAALMPDAVAALVAAETVAAELADPYLTQVLDDDSAATALVDVGGMVEPSGSLLYLPAVQASTAIGQGLGVGAALVAAGHRLAMYTQTSVADTARSSVAAGMAARPHATGYYRALRPPSCSRCAILAGRFYKWNAGFKRHPRCDCVHTPVNEPDDRFEYDAHAAIAAGQVTGLSKADLKAIVEHGANPAQVVNAKQAMYDVGQFQATHASTTRRSIPGARMLARSVDRSFGIDVTKQTYKNMSFDRLTAAKYAEMFRAGKTYTRFTRSGRPQRYAYRFLRTPRPTAQQIVVSASSRSEAVRLLTNYGYII